VGTDGSFDVSLAGYFSIAIRVEVIVRLVQCDNRLSR
jgi:hypothetical protein